MRTIFMKELIKQAQVDKNIYLVVGDVGFSVIEEYKALFPQRYLNAGIAEQNMIGVAAGLAMAGKRVFVYTIIPFLIKRCFEQIRLNICYQELPVTLVGVGGGFSYGSAATSHHALEDIALMRTLPGMTVIAPGSKYETEKLSTQLFSSTSPTYFRLSNNDEQVMYPENCSPTIGKALPIIPSSRYLIIATGNALDLGFGVCTTLRKTGLDIGLISMPTIKPLDTVFLEAQAARVQGIFTIEEHNVIGGLGEAIARYIAESYPKKIVFKAFGVQDFYFHVAASRAYYNEQAGLTVDFVSSTILGLLQSNKWSEMSPAQ